MHYSRKLEYAFFLCLGVLITFILNQHLVGKAAVYTCDAIAPRQKNFVFEVFLLASLTMIVFSLFYLKNILSPFIMVFSITLIVGLLFLQNYTTGLAFKETKAGWTAEKVIGDDKPALEHKSKWRPKHKWSKHDA